MSSRTLPSLLLLACAATSCAEPTVDISKKKLTQIFVEPAAQVTAATVRVLGDNTEVALGAVVSADGFIVTKGSELRGTLACRLADGRAFPAKFVDYHRATDLAMLKIEASGLKVVEFSTKAEADTATMVAATGSGSEPVAAGMIGAKARKLYGADAIIADENRGKLGVFGLRDAEFTDGALVPEVDPGQGADRAGMKPGDVIVEIAGKRAKDRDAVLELMANRRRGDRVIVQVRRDEREIALDIRLGPYAEGDLFTAQQNMGGLLSGRRTGFPEIASHDALVRAADCGGPLVDLDGNVLGLNVARAGRTETWLLPSRVIVPLLPSLKAAKYGDWLGR